MVERAGVPLPVAQEMWHLLGFAHQADDEVAFAEADVEALRFAHDLMELGILSDDRLAALVRTWGRSYARLAEWQTSLLADVAMSQGALEEALPELAATVLPRVESLQSYVWRRHLLSAASRLLAVGAAGTSVIPMAVVFVDIVGFTSRSKTMTEAELVEWLEGFENACTGIVVDHGGRIIKNIGDEVLFVTENVVAAADAALTLTERGADPEDDFPKVRAGLAYGDVVARLGDVFGPTVNIASRLTSVARPCTVLVDRGARDALVGDEPDAGLVEKIASLTRGEQPEDHPEEHEDTEEHPAGERFNLRRLRRTSVKGYSRLQSWVLRRREPA